MIRRPPRSTPFPTRRSSDLPVTGRLDEIPEAGSEAAERHGPLVGGVAPHDLGRGRSGELGHLLEGEIGKSTRLNSSHANIWYAVFCLKKHIPASYQVLARRA